jgi:hypothetical protein
MQNFVVFLIAFDQLREDVNRRAFPKDLVGCTTSML